MEQRIARALDSQLQSKARSSKLSEHLRLCFRGSRQHAGAHPFQCSDFGVGQEPAGLIEQLADINFFWRPIGSKCSSKIPSALKHHLLEVKWTPKSRQECSLFKLGT